MNNKPKLVDQDLKERLLEAIRLGMYTEHACAYAGITSATFRNWRKLAEDGVEPYKSFWISVSKAEADAIVRRVARIEQAGKDGSWQADAWLLERKYPDKFGKRDKLQLQGDPNAPVEIELNWADGKKLDREKEIIIDIEDIEVQEDE